MWAIFKREISSFFSSPIAYLIIGLFLLLSGLFLWVFDGPYNILNAGFADMSNFFLLSPWIFLFIIPAICMKSISEEIKLGTLELLYIKPPSLWQVVLGKYMAAVLLSVLAVIPTMVYMFAISELGTSTGNMDVGLALGSYMGLFFLISTFAGISVFASSLTDNQIVAFITGLALCFLFFYVSEGLATLFQDGESYLFVKSLGLKVRFEAMARGVLDSRDLIYFLSLAFFFLFLTVNQLKNRRR